jgi:predicted acylesterase/phospholipase RssA
VPEESEYCDLVMKGGITSGVVYPRAVCRLAEQYRFRNIGGTSAGAIAAAATAAAEYGREMGGEAFSRLEELPGELGKDETLLRLFQPQARTRRLHGLLIAGLRRKVRGIARALAPYWRAAAVGATPAALLTAMMLVAAIADGSAWVIVPAAVLALLGILLTLLGAVLAVVLWVVRDLNVGVVANGFGLCSGMPGEEAEEEALTPWLHRTLGECAGTLGRERPLTFGDLWSPHAPDDEPATPDDRYVNLAMMTTNLINRRGHELPWEGGGWYFSPRELSGLFPPDVVRHMVEHPRPLPEEEGERWRSRVRRGIAWRQGLRPLPEAKDLPVIVATRMSLSFPILLSAVPLWQYDLTWEENAGRLDLWRDWAKELPPEARDEILDHPGGWSTQEIPEESPVLERCWFSDGGISSNFPVQFFDRLVPRWPTFAIDLRPFPFGREESDDQAENVEMPKSNGDLATDWWYRLPLPSGKLLGFADGRLRGFLGSIVKTMQNRVDEAQMRVPGYRDRIAHVNLADDEGGMNLNMEGTVIEELAERGEVAARRLISAYVPADRRGKGVSWRNQRWTRFRSSLAVLEQMSGYFSRGSKGPDIAGGADSLIETAETRPLQAWQKALAREEVEQLAAISDAAAAATAAAGLEEGEAPGMAYEAPSPPPVGRISPKD